MGLEPRLTLGGSGGGVHRRGEHDEEAVPLGTHLPPPPRLEGRAQYPAVPAQASPYADPSPFSSRVEPSMSLNSIVVSDDATSFIPT